MDLVKVKKDDLLEKIRSNREEHRRVVIEAQQGFIKESEKVLRKALKKLKNDGSIENFLRFNPPANHLREYDTAISMLEFTLDDIIELDRESFRNYVLDEWTWKKSFYMSNAPYSNLAASTKFNDED